jgi:hypothetical protein
VPEDANVSTILAVLRLLGDVGPWGLLIAAGAAVVRLLLSGDVLTKGMAEKLLSLLQERLADMKERLAETIKLFQDALTTAKRAADAAEQAAGDHATLKESHSRILAAIETVRNESVEARRVLGERLDRIQSDIEELRRGRPGSGSR